VIINYRIYFIKLLIILSVFLVGDMISEGR